MNRPQPRTAAQPRTAGRQDRPQPRTAAQAAQARQARQGAAGDRAIFLALQAFLEIIFWSVGWLFGRYRQFWRARQWWLFGLVWLFGHGGGAGHNRRSGAGNRMAGLSAMVWLGMASLCITSFYASLFGERDPTQPCSIPAIGHTHPSPTAMNQHLGRMFHVEHLGRGVGSGVPCTCWRGGSGWQYLVNRHRTVHTAHYYWRTAVPFLRKCLKCRGFRQ